MTKIEKISYLENIERIAPSGDKIVIAVKIADNEDNPDPERIARLPANPRILDQQIAKYQASLEILRRAVVA